MKTDRKFRKMGHFQMNMWHERETDFISLDALLFKIQLNENKIKWIKIRLSPF